MVRILGQRLDDSRIQRTEGTSLRKYPPLDPSVAKDFEVHRFSCHDQVVFFRVVCGDDSVFFAAESLQSVSAVRRNIVRICGEIECIASAVESGQVVQGERVETGGKVNGSGFLPSPFFTVGSEDFRQFGSIRFEREASGGSPAFPDGGPVAGSKIFGRVFLPLNASGRIFRL